MAQLLITPEDVADLSDQLELPFTIAFQDGKLSLTGAVDILWEQSYQIDLAFRNMDNQSIILEIVDSKPRFGTLDNWIKRFLTRFIPEDVSALVQVEYPYVTVVYAHIPQLREVVESIGIEGIEFTGSGIKVTAPIPDFAAFQSSISHQMD